jgi:tetratricopeptide (TPR) repeat protein
MKKCGTLLILCFLLRPAADCIGAVPTQTYIEQLFDRGNSEYQKGNYGSAEQQYRQILNSGVESGPVYYNLGNVYFKQKRLGESIYCWEKALQKMPADQETQGNLDLANLLLVDRIEIPTDPLSLKILARMRGLLTIDQTSTLVLILFIVANILFSIYWLAKHPRSAAYALIGGFAIGFVFLLSGCSLSWNIYERAHRKEGIVIEQKVDIRSGPGPENIVIFPIHEGIKVRVLGSGNGWYQISLPNGWNGWLPQNVLHLL